MAISFFFASIFIVAVYFLGEEKMNFYSSLINSMVVNPQKEVEAEYSIETKRVVKLPSIGTRIGILKIDKLGLSLPLYHGDNLKILRHGVGHYAGSYFPGENGSIIIAGHNQKGTFEKLPELVEGDQIVIEANYGTFTYEVESYKVVSEDDLDAWPIQKDRELLILYTCWPINRSVVGRRTQRYIVYSHKVGESYE